MDRFVLSHRGPKPSHDPWRHQAVIVEDERTAAGPVARVATVFLTGRECPWRCVMCDLWQYTTDGDTPAGAIPAQVAAARQSLAADPAPVEHMKLYNAGSFFDPRAVPEGDYDAIALQLSGLSRIVVESHPALVGPRVDRFVEALDRAHRSIMAVEVAMGLETVHPDALERLNKRMTVDDFASAATSLAARGIGLRAFLLISPPFVPPDEQDAWLLRSIDVAFECGASVVSLVPTRSGNGAIEALAAAGSFKGPRLGDIERSFDAALTHAQGRGCLFVDLWDFERFTDCAACAEARRLRLHEMNLTQRVLPPIACSHDEARGAAS